MVSAVTPDEVRSLFKSFPIPATVTEAEIRGWISDADLIVTEDLASTEPTLTTARKNLITKFLAGHFGILSIEQGGVKRSRVGGADESYNLPPPEATGYSSTRFGQQALTLDLSGTLANAAISAASLRSEFRVV